MTRPGRAEVVGGSPAARIVRNALLKGAVQGTRLLSLALLVLAARVLGPEAFGKFTFAYALATLFGAALDLGMHAVLVREIARAPAETAGRWAAAVTLKLGLLVPAGLALVATPLLTGRPADTTAAVWLLGGAIALQSFIELAVSVFTAFERLEFELSLRIVEKLVLVGVGAWALVTGAGLFGVSGAFTVAAGVSLMLAVALVHRRFARLDWRWQPARAVALGRALGPVALAFVLGFATTRVIPLIVALVGGDVAAGHFGAALRVLDVVVVIPVAIGAAVYPVLARTPGDAPEFARVVRRTLDILLLLGLAVALGLGQGAVWLTRAVFGPTYGATAAPLALLGIAACLSFLHNLLGLVFLALDRPGRLLLLAAGGCLASLLLTPVLVGHFGALGGAVALVAVEALVLAFALLAVIPLLGRPFGVDALKGLGAAAGAMGLAVLAPDEGAWRLLVAEAAYVGGVMVLRAHPEMAWGALLRSAVTGAGLPPSAPGPTGPPESH